MTDLPEDRDALLEALVCGEVDPASPGAQARLAADPQLAARWREFAQLETALGDAARLRAEALAAAERNEPVDAEAELLARIRAGAPRPSLPAAPTDAARGALRLLLAAAAMVAVVLGAAFFGGVFDGRPSEETPQYRWLGGGDFGIAEDLPFGLLRFRLRDDAALDAEVTVRVHAVDASGRRVELLEEWLDPGPDSLVVPPDLLDGREALDWEIEVRSALSAVPSIHLHRQQR